MSILDKIILKPLAADQYFPDAANKTQIYVHHTASSPDPYGVLTWWGSTSDKVATAFVVGGKPTLTSQKGKWKDGDLLQCFGSDKWGWHLGLTSAQLKAGNPGAKSNTDLNKMSIGIEICNFGGLTKTNKGYATYVGNIIPDTDVVAYPKPYRGYSFFQKYTPAQLDIVHELLGFLCDKYGIPKTYAGDRIFDICPDALRGNSSVYTHSSVRPDKSDCHPQKELIDVLKSI